MSHKPGMFSSWGGGPVPDGHDVEDFAAGFVRFENGASLVVETSWILHHEAEMDGFHFWLYGTDGGIEHPGNRLVKTNYDSKQLYTTELKLMQDPDKPHTLGVYGIRQSHRRRRSFPCAG
jgi:predicted dehydrogenase